MGELEVGVPLELVGAVDWGGLHHAYGAADDVPAQLRGLLSQDAEERERAFHALGGNVYHQGTRWQASCHVVPFLAELVDYPHTPERVGVAALLRAVALGDRDDGRLPFAADREFASAESVTDVHIATALECLYGDEDEGTAEDDEVLEAVALAWDRDAYLAAAAMTERFVAWTADADPGVAAWAAELLAWFPPTDSIVAALLAVPETGRNAVARASANLTLAHLPAATPEIDRRLTALLDAGHYGVQLTAAVALAFRMGDRMPYPGLRPLVEARDRADEISARTFPVPWYRPLTGFASLALRRIGLAI